MSAREHRSLRRKMEKEETMHLKRLARALEGNHEGDFVDRGVPQYKAIPPQYKEITPYSRWTHWPLPETSPQPKSIPWVRLPHDYAKVYRGDKLRNWVMHISAKMGPGKVLHKSLSAWCFNVWKRSRTTDVHIARITKLDEKIEMYTRELRDGEAKLRRDIATLLLQAALHEMTRPICKGWLHDSSVYRVTLAKFLKDRWDTINWRSKVVDEHLTGHAAVMRVHAQSVWSRYRRRAALRAGKLEPHEVELAKEELAENKKREIIAGEVNYSLRRTLRLVERATTHVINADLIDLELGLEAWERQAAQITINVGRVLRKHGIHKEDLLSPGQRRHRARRALQTELARARREGGEQPPQSDEMEDEGGNEDDGLFIIAKSGV